MGLGIKFVLYLGAFFLMIVVALLRIIPVNYLGEIVIALFIMGLFYSWLNAWRQTKNMIVSEHRSSYERESEIRENTGQREEEPIVAA